MIWFTADLHLGHKNIIRYCDRPFKSVGEMDGRLVDNWNQRVGYGEEVYVLGDFTLGNAQEAEEYLYRLKGRKKIVPGGHDYWIAKFEGMSGVEILPKLYNLELADYPLIVLCHYAMRTWPKSHYSSWNLHGHSHGNLSGEHNQLDVGVDVWGYAPISLEEVRGVLE